MDDDLLADKVFQIIDVEHPDNVVPKFVKIKPTRYQMEGDNESLML